MNLSTANMDKKLNEYLAKFKILERNEKIAWVGLLVGVFLVIISLFLM